MAGSKADCEDLPDKNDTAQRGKFEKFRKSWYHRREITGVKITKRQRMSGISGAGHVHVYERNEENWTNYLFISRSGIC